MRTTLVYLYDRYSYEYFSHFNTIIAKQNEECPSSSPSDCTTKTIIFTYSFRTLSSIFSFLTRFPQIVLLGKKRNALIFMLLILQSDSLHSSSHMLLAVEELCAASSCYKRIGWKKFFCDVATDNVFIDIYMHIHICIRV